jgi:hypothetical protein
MRRVIGIDIHRTFGELVFWEEGRLRQRGRIDMTRAALEGFGRSVLATDEVVIKAILPPPRPFIAQQRRSPAWRRTGSR